MENNRLKNRKKAIISEILAFAIIASGCAKTSENVIINLKNQKEEEDIKPTVEVEEATWVEFDEETLMYKVDLDGFLKDKLKLSKKTIENEDVINIIEIIHKELGEDLYVKNKNDRELYNLEGKSVTLSSYGDRMFYASFDYGEESDDKLTIKYDVNVETNGKTSNVSREIIKNDNETSKYFVIYNGKKEYTRTILLRSDRINYISIGLHESDINFSTPSISFGTDIGDASVKLSEEEYKELYEIMLSYQESNNLHEFLIESIDLLNKYLKQIEAKDPVFYEQLSSIIDGFIEKGKTLRYE